MDVVYVGLFVVDTLKFPAFSVVFLVVFDALEAPADVFILQGFYNDVNFHLSGTCSQPQPLRSAFIA